MLFSFLVQPDFRGRISLLLLLRVEMITFWKDSFLGYLLSCELQVGRGGISQDTKISALENKSVFLKPVLGIKFFVRKFLKLDFFF
jgi:hypothetical protein